MSPPPPSGLRIRTLLSLIPPNANPARMSRMSPSARDFRRERSVSICGWHRYMNASMRKTPRRFAAAIMAFASAAFMANGFSQSTCLPAAMALSVQGQCRWLGRAM